MASQDDKSSNLPMDIIENVLSRLPTKSLLRFKAVCKSWNILISDPGFVQTHLQQSKNSNSHNLFFGKQLAANSPEKFSLLRLEDRKFRTEAVFDAPNVWDAMKCSCDGVVLLMVCGSNMFHLWNPSSRMTTRFWFPYKFFDNVNYGLCHDPAMEDFKIVITSWGYYAVYSCKNKSWTKIRDFAYTRGIKKDPGLFVDGAVYWVWTEWVDKYIRETVENSTRDIVYFDPRGDELKMLQKPKDLKNTEEISLICLRNRFCVCFNNVDESMFQIWMKEEGRDRNSWMEFMTIENIQAPLGLLKPLCLQEDKIVIHLEGTRFLIYSPCEKTFEVFEDAELPNIRLVPYVDSLLFFPIQKTLPQRNRKRRIAD